MLTGVIIHSKISADDDVTINIRISDVVTIYSRISDDVAIYRRISDDVTIYRRISDDVIIYSRISDDVTICRISAMQCSKGRYVFDLEMNADVYHQIMTTHWAIPLYNDSNCTRVHYE